MGLSRHNELSIHYHNWYPASVRPYRKKRHLGIWASGLQFTCLDHSHWRNCNWLPNKREMPCGANTAVDKDMNAVSRLIFAGFTMQA